MVQNTALENTPNRKEQTLARARQAKARYQARQKRLILKERPKLLPPQDPEYKNQIRLEIDAAVQRIQSKRNFMKTKNEYPTTA